jgi:hypothetical protein
VTRVRFHRAASAEAEAAVRWYEERVEGLGADFRAEVVLGVERIAERPSVWPPSEHDPRARRYLLSRFPYSIVYVVAEDGSVPRSRPSRTPSDARHIGGDGSNPNARFQPFRAAGHGRRSEALLTANLVKVQALFGPRLGKDIFFCSFTLKPELDTPRVLAAYSRRFGAGPGWQFLTGSPADLESCRRHLGFTDPDPARDADKLNHTGMVRFGNEPLTLWSACPGLSRPESLANSILSVDWKGRRQSRATPPSSCPPARAGG